MLLFIADTLVELLLRCAVFLSTSFELVDRLVAFLVDNRCDILQVMQQYLTLLLFLCLLVQIVDFAHVIELLVEVFLRVDKGVEKVTVFAILFGLEVE